MRSTSHLFLPRSISVFTVEQCSSIDPPASAARRGLCKLTPRASPAASACSIRVLSANPMGIDDVERHGVWDLQCRSVSIGPPTGGHHHANPARAAINVEKCAALDTGVVLLARRISLSNLRPAGGPQRRSPAAGGVY